MDIGLRRGRSENHASQWSRLSALLRTHSCEHAYLDVGSNIGVQIRKLFEPSLYPMSEQTSLQAFQGIYGPAPRCHVCAVGLEPNPRHAERLRLLEDKLITAQAPVAILRAAAATANGAIDFFIPTVADGSNDRGARGVRPTGAYRGLDVGKRVRVEALDLARLIRKVRGALPEGAQMLMKMDVEGMEQTILPHLIDSRAICLLNTIAVEWHVKHQFYNESLGGVRSRAMLIDSLRRVRCARELSAVDMDDEAYEKDGAPWPAPNMTVCTAASEGGGRRGHRRSRSTVRAGARVPRLATHDSLETPLDGFCGRTINDLAGACAHGDSGSWSGVPSLAACAAKCLGCSRCNYVSFSKLADDCSWYRECRVLTQRVGDPHNRALDGSFRTARVRNVTQGRRASTRSARWRAETRARL